jgi:hypothetical protein
MIFDFFFFNRSKIRLSRISSSSTMQRTLLTNLLQSRGSIWAPLLLQCGFREIKNWNPKI